MDQEHKHQKTLEDVRGLVESTETPDLRRRNGRSAAERICVMAGVLPTQLAADAPSIELGTGCHAKQANLDERSARSVKVVAGALFAP